MCYTVVSCPAFSFCSLIKHTSLALSWAVDSAKNDLSAWGSREGKEG